MAIMFGEKDLPTILAGLDRLPQQLTAAGIASQIVTIPGVDHFYLRTASVPQPDGSSTDVET
ncbi:hypothetical protein, partial [Rhodopseudomonas sp. B29]|uniref:hypothetical protein n=1 Tax=Rhodopseudomonas sp. B29 TaxID=95607 RepID=UPI001900DEF7